MPQECRKGFTLQAPSSCDEPIDDWVVKETGFSLRPGVAAKGDERKKLQRLCRYLRRPTVSKKRLMLTPSG